MRGAPQEWVGTAHRSNQLADLARDCGPSGSSVPNLPCPKQAEAFAVPGDDSLWFDDDQRGSPTDPESGQPCTEETIRHGQLRLFLGGAPEYTDLMPQRQDLHLEGGARTED
jgi:hypothetical protein